MKNLPKYYHILIMSVIGTILSGMVGCFLFINVLSPILLVPPFIPALFSIFSAIGLALLHFEIIERFYVECYKQGHGQLEHVLFARFVARIISIIVVFLSFFATYFCLQINL